MQPIRMYIQRDGTELDVIVVGVNLRLQAVGEDITVHANNPRSGHEKDYDTSLEAMLNALFEDEYATGVESVKITPYTLRIRHSQTRDLEFFTELLVRALNNECIEVTFTNEKGEDLRSA